MVNQRKILNTKKLNNNIDYVLSATHRLAPKSGDVKKLRSLPISKQLDFNGGWTWIALPGWAADIVPKDKKGLFVPTQSGTSDWKDYNWWLGAAMLINSSAERQHENENGSIHSNSFRLDPKMIPAFEYAWTNRIILFLRRWWSHENHISEEKAFSPIPPAVIHLTHDVDAVSKTLAIRIKQAIFSLYNKRPKAAIKFLLSNSNYWQFDKIIRLEERYGYRSLWNFYGARGGFFRSFKEHIFDPAYDIYSTELKDQICLLSKNGNKIGLHPRFDTWQDANKMTLEKENIEKVLGQKIYTVRQHWLRFSFDKTWKTQKKAGLVHDYTLGFNDRYGFRNSTALTFIDSASGIRVTPLVLMDSHLFDYSNKNQIERFKVIDSILDELEITGGEGSVIWHQRVFHSDYGWGDDYEYLLDGMKKRQITTPEMA
jgi:hypothetical protein